MLSSLGVSKLALFPKEMINQSSKLMYTFIKLIAIAIFHTPYSNILKVWDKNCHVRVLGSWVQRFCHEFGKARCDWEGNGHKPSLYLFVAQLKPRRWGYNTRTYGSGISRPGARRREEKDEKWCDWREGSLAAKWAMVFGYERGDVGCEDFVRFHTANPLYVCGADCSGPQK